jgi:hypothetical protein
VDVDEVAAHVRDRLGMEPQAIAPFRVARRGAWAGRVWQLMTERGNFWLVEDGTAAELFLAAVPIGTAAAPVSYPTTARAVARFHELHPADPRAAATPTPPARPADDALIRFTCRSCGGEVAQHRWSAAVERALCGRCRRAQRHRERYHSDPEYRAQCLARMDSYYRRVRRKGPT